jgi:hypothetical protein
MQQNQFMERLQAQFAQEERIDRGVLYAFCTEFEPDLSESTFAWRVHALKEKGLLNAVGRGAYTLRVKPVFRPVLDQRLAHLARRIRKAFPELVFCIWSTEWLNGFMQHQAGKHLVVVDVEPSALETVFYFLQDERIRSVFLDPDAEVVERYLFHQTSAVAVRPLVSKAPLERRGRLVVPASEKILVDLFTDRMLFAFAQGAELHHIYRSWYEQHGFNRTTLLAYARRRGKYAALQDFLESLRLGEKERAHDPR